MPSVLRRAITVLSLLTLITVLANVAAAQVFDPFGGGGDPFTDPLPPKPEREVKPRPAVEIPPAAVVAEAPQGETQIQKALRTPTTLDFIETPLSDIAKFIDEIHGINVELDKRALEDIGLAADTPLTFSIRGVTLRSAMRLMLKEIDSGFVERDGALVITTDWEEEDYLITKVYSLHTLLPKDELFDYRFAGEEIVDLITSIVSPHAWEDVGGPGSVQLMRKSLIVSTYPRVQREVAALLKTLEEAQQLVKKSKSTPPKTTWLPRPPVWQQRIEKALAEKVEIDFRETPLQDVADFLSDKAKIPILIDYRALEDIGIGSDTPISRRLKHVSLRGVLRVVLKEMDLTVVIHNEVLLITTPEEAESELESRVYPVADLILPIEDGADELVMDDWRVQADYDSLMDLIVSAVRPDTWEDVGGPGAVEPWEGCLVISQTGDVFDEIDGLLSGLRKLHAKRRADRTAILTEPLLVDEIDSPQHARLREALNIDVKMLAYKKTRFSEVVQSLADAHDLPIVLDYRALDDSGIDPLQPVSATLGGESLAQALRRLLRPFDLEAIIRDEVIFITTPEEAEYSLRLRIYPVADLVLSNPAENIIDFLGMDADFDTLTEAIHGTVRPNTWEDVGGPGAIVPYVQALGLVVAQTDEVHDDIVDLLANIREAEAIQRKAEAEASTEEAEDESAGEDIVKNKQGEQVHLKIYRLANSDQENADELAKTIAELIEPQSWKADEANYLRALSGAIIVRHTADAQRTTKKLLDALDVLAWPQFGDGTVGGGNAQGIDNGDGFNAGGGGIFAVPDHIRGQFGGIGGGGLGGAPFGIMQRVQPYVTLTELSIPATDDQPALPLRIYHITANEEDDIEQTIRELIDPDGWKLEGRYLRLVSGKLVVRGEAKVHRKIHRLLVALEMIIHERPAPGFSGGIPVVGQRFPHAPLR